MLELSCAGTFCLDRVWGQGKLAFERDCLLLARDSASLAKLMDAEERSVFLGYCAMLLISLEKVE